MPPEPQPRVLSRLVPGLAGVRNGASSAAGAGPFGERRDRVGPIHNLEMAVAEYQTLRAGEGT